jgi:hypothetical protein
VITPADPTEEELRAWYDANGNEYKQPDQYTVMHVYFDPDKRDATTQEDAASALAELKEGGGQPQNIADYGDRLMLQNYYPG